MTEKQKARGCKSLNLILPKTLYDKLLENTSISHMTITGEIIQMLEWQMEPRRGYLRRNQKNSGATPEPSTDETILRQNIEIAKVKWVREEDDD